MSVPSELIGNTQNSFQILAQRGANIVTRGGKRKSKRTKRMARKSRKSRRGGGRTITFQNLDHMANSRLGKMVPHGDVYTNCNTQSGGGFGFTSEGASDAATFRGGYPAYTKYEKSKQCGGKRRRRRKSRRRRGGACNPGPESGPKCAPTQKCVPCVMVNGKMRDVCVDNNDYPDPKLCSAKGGRRKSRRRRGGACNPGPESGPKCAPTQKCVPCVMVNGKMRDVCVDNNDYPDPKLCSAKGGRRRRRRRKSRKKKRKSRKKKRKSRRRRRRKKGGYSCGLGRKKRQRGGSSHSYGSPFAGGDRPWATAPLGISKNAPSCYDNYNHHKGL